MGDEGKRQVLIVDDDDAICEMLELILEDEGYEPIRASNGQEALNKLRASTSPCLILLDLNMPVMTGWDFRRMQQQDPRLAPIPVVIISADRSLAHGSTALNAIEYFRKPIDLDRLLGLLSTICA